MNEILAERRLSEMQAKLDKLIAELKESLTVANENFRDCEKTFESAAVAIGRLSARVAELERRAEREDSYRQEQAERG